MKTVTMLAAALVGLTPLPLSYSFQTLGTHPSHLSAPSLPVLTAPSLPALTQPLFQRVPVSQTPLPLPVPEVPETLTPILPVEETGTAGEEGAGNEAASPAVAPEDVQQTPGRSEEAIEREE